MGKQSKIDSILETAYTGGIKILIDNSDKKLAKKIKIFREHCRKRELNPFIQESEKTYGIDFRPRWKDDMGFTFTLCIEYPPVDSDVHHTVDELVDACKMQIKYIKTARHSLAVLLRLWKKLQLPGPVQEIRSDPVRMGFIYVQLTQQEIEEFLKY